MGTAISTDSGSASLSSISAAPGTRTTHAPTGHSTHDCELDTCIHISPSLRRLKADPKGVVGRFIALCHARTPDTRLIPPNSEIYDLADGFSVGLMQAPPNIGRHTWTAVMETDLIETFASLIMEEGFFQEPPVSRISRYLAVFGRFCLP